MAAQHSPNTEPFAHVHAQVCAVAPTHNKASVQRVHLCLRAVGGWAMQCLKMVTEPGVKRGSLVTESTVRVAWQMMGANSTAISTYTVCFSSGICMQLGCLV